MMLKRSQLKAFEIFSPAELILLFFKVKLCSQPSVEPRLSRALGGE